MLSILSILFKIRHLLQHSVAISLGRCTLWTVKLLLKSFPDLKVTEMTRKYPQQEEVSHRDKKWQNRFINLTQNPTGWRNDTQHNDTQLNDTQDDDIQHNDTQHNDTQRNDTQHTGLFATLGIKDTQCKTLPLIILKCRVQFIVMLNVVMLTVVMLNVVTQNAVLNVVIMSVIMLSVVAPT